MSCDIHVRLEVRASTPAADYRQALVQALAEVDRRVIELGEPRTSNWMYDGLGLTGDAVRATELVDLEIVRSSLTEQLATIADAAGSTDAWAIPSRPFESSCPVGPNLVATAELLATLSDGQLVETAALCGRLALGGEEPELTPHLNSVVMSVAARVDADNELEHRVAQARAGSVPRLDGNRVPPDVDSHGYWQPGARLAAARRADVTLSPDDRTRLEAAVLTYDPDGFGPPLVSFHRAVGEPAHMVDNPFLGSDPDLFAILGDVRNRAGLPSEVGAVRLTPISSPRGIPLDISPEGALFLTSMGFDGHSHSVLTLEELRAYDWNDVRRFRHEFVEAAEYDRCTAEGVTPRGTAKTLPDALTFTEDGYVAWVAAGRPDIASAGDAAADPATTGAAGLLHRPAVWSGDVRLLVTREDGAAVIPRWWRNVLDQMDGFIPEDGTAADVRLVLFFDN